jgi:hypothetical protein
MACILNGHRPALEKTCIAIHLWSKSWKHTPAIKGQKNG